MLALKKKREVEAKQAAAEEEAAAAAAAAASAAAAESNNNNPAEPASSTSSSVEKVSLLGIGGKKKSSSGTAGASNGGGKKRSPGEIRIQKGACVCPSTCVVYWLGFLGFLFVGFHSPFQILPSFFFVRARALSHPLSLTLLLKHKPTLQHFHSNRHCRIGFG